MRLPDICGEGRTWRAPDVVRTIPDTCRDNGRYYACSGARGAADGKETCRVCDAVREWSDEVPRIFDAVMLFVRDRVLTPYEGQDLPNPRELEVVPLAAVGCPSPEDTCGDPAPFAKQRSLGSQ